MTRAPEVKHHLTGPETVGQRLCRSASQEQYMADTITKPNTKRARKMAREPGPESTSEVQAGANAEPTKPPSKTSLILGMLQREEGTTLEQMVEATGWLPHTTRAAMTGLRKKGHAIIRTKVDGVTRYTIAAGATQ